MENELVPSEPQETEREIYAPVIDRCNELFTLVEANYPASHQLKLVDTTPGAWENYGAIVLNEGVSTATTIVIQDPLHPELRVTISEVTRTEATFNDLDLSAHLIIITKRYFPAFISSMPCEQRILVVSPFFTSAAIMNFTETTLPDGLKQTDILNYFFDHDKKLSEAERAGFEASLEAIAQARPILINGQVAYYSSFDALCAGNRDKIVAGRMKDGINKKDFVRDTMALLQGEPAPLTRYDLETETDQLVQRYLSHDESRGDMQYLQRQLIVIPAEGYPDLPSTTI